MKPLALDLFCGCGGVAEGLARAGYEVVGIDSNPRCGRYYPGTFVVGDALAPPVRLADFALVWASPPCQRWSTATRSMPGTAAEHPDMIGPTRALLAGHPWTVIENVPFAPIRPDVVLTGPMFGLDRIIRRRHFETSWFALQPPMPPRDRDLFPSGRGVTVTTSLSSHNHFYPRKRIGLRGRVPVLEGREVMGIATAMPGWGVGEAIPPAFAEFIASTIPGR